MLSLLGFVLTSIESPWAFGTVASDREYKEEGLLTPETVRSDGWAKTLYERGREIFLQQHIESDACLKWYMANTVRLTKLLNVI